MVDKAGSVLSALQVMEVDSLERFDTLYGFSSNDAVLRRQPCSYIHILVYTPKSIA